MNHSQNNAYMLIEATKAGALVLSELMNVETGAQEIVACAVIKTEEGMQLRPLATVINGNGYATYFPPNPAVLEQKAA